MKRHRTVTISDGTKLREVRTESGTAAPAKRHFVRDHLGSIRAVVDDTGTSLETDDYYPLGGPLPTGTATALQPEKYQGKEWNTAAGFNVYDFGARLYDPGLGRWLSLDPMTEQYYFHSPYLFCAGNPMKFVDPEGTHWYTINENGEIQMLMERDNEQYDRLFLYDKQIGPPNLFSSIVVNNQDILRGRSFLQDVPQSVSIQELLNIFFFVSDAYLDREWDYIQMENSVLS
ncbi:MAG: RHS repeat-associated core domain-containing protein [Bacteroidales bacterium]|nr:RHS repeat-associated core domain-containing protein [Bacteroidales bacterium]